jgi:DNA-binding transcriptional ArsR family regulator
MAARQNSFQAKCTTEECRFIEKKTRASIPLLSDNSLIKQRALLFHALGNKTRLSILGMLSMQEMCTCDIVEALEIAASTLNHHLRMLEDGGLITSRRVGKFTIYSLNDGLLSWHRVFD